MIAAHRRPAASHRRRTRSVLAAVVAIATAGTFLAVADSASAAGNWFVAAGGSTLSTCGTSVAPCATVSIVIAKPGFAAGDTINVGAGTYTDHPTFTTKGAILQGAGAASTIFDGSNAQYALGSTLPAAQTLSLNNMTFQHGSPTSGLGGGLAIGGGQIITNNVNLTSNKAVEGAGAYVLSGASLSMTGGAVTGNIATANTTALTGAGGAFYVAGRVGTTTAAGQLNLTNVTVNNNSAVGNAQAATGNGGAIFNAGTTTIAGSSFSGNVATASTNTSNPRRGQGGAIFNGGNDTDDLPSLTITNTTITGGLATGSFNSSSGGAIANAESFGGLAGAVLNATNLTLTGDAALLGGGIYNGGSVSMTGGTIQSSSALSGAGVYQALLVIPTAIRPTASFTGTAFTNNVANGLTFANFGNGGAVFNEAGLTVKNATFTGNQAVASSAASTLTAWGGSIYNGAFAANDAPTAAISNTQFNGGTAASNASVGGAIANVGNVLGLAGASNGALTSTGDTYSKNSALVAGAVYTGGATTITGATFDSNKATNSSLGFGGALYASKTQTAGPTTVVTLDSSTFTNNSAAVLGGALAVLTGANVTLQNGSTVNHNSSAVSAGGIYNTAALTVQNSAVSNNTAAFQGAGIYNGPASSTDTPALTLTNATVDNNTAANVGGGVLTLAGATLAATGGEISGNSALGGGGLYIGDSAPASFDGTKFVGNTATASEGGAIINSGSLTLTHALLDTNHAVHTTGNIGIGAAIYSGSNSNNVATALTVESSTISNNDAWAGAALATFSPGTGATNVTSINNSTIVGNSNGTSVGAIEQFHPLTITNSTITDNSSASGASALTLVAPTTVSVAGDIFSNNSGGSCSAKPVDGGYNEIDPTDASCGFTTAKFDVGALPQLGALGTNGGPTPTRVPGPASPALDKISAGTTTTITNAVTGNAVTLCASGSSDQRGVARPQGAKCDIGSVEVAQVVPVVSGPSSIDYSIGVMGTAVTFTSTGTPQATLTETGALPAGVTFVDNHDGTATLSGTPTSGPGGHYAITVVATNEAGHGTLAFDLVLHQAPVLGGPSNATYTVGQAGTPQVFTMTTGFPTASLSTTSTLPNGVTFTDNGDGTATIAGTPAAGTGGTYSIVIKGSNGTPPDASFTFTLTVDQQPTIAGPASATFTVGTAGTSGAFTTTGFPAATLSAAGLPVGLSVVSTGPGTATISGTPAAGTGGEYDVTVTATNGVGTDASTTIHLVIKQAPALIGASTARFVAGTAATVGFSATGYPQAGLTESGALPAGVTFVDNGNGTATLAGTAAIGSDGTYAITITASNNVSPDAVIHFVLTVVPPVSITSGTLPAAQVGTAYGAQLQAIGGQPAYHFSIVAGALPAGLSLADDGTITGTPTGPTGTFSVTAKVVDSASPAQTSTKVLSITVGKGVSKLVVDPVLLSTSVVGLGLSVTVGSVSATLTGGTANHPITGQTIVFKAGTATVCSGITDTNGVAGCSMSVVSTLAAILAGGVTATYAGNALWLPSTGTAGLVSLH